MTKKKKHILVSELTEFSKEVASEIQRLVTFLSSDYSPLSDEEIKEMIASPMTHILLARLNEIIVGMITVIIYRISYTKKSILEDLVVDPAYRGRGIGSQLLMSAVTRAKKENVTYIDLTSRPSRVESNKLYEKFGFKKRETNVYRIYCNEK